jgi:hypothetical protein
VKVWTTGIIEAEVNSAFFTARNTLQPQLHEIASANYFGDSVEKILVVFVVSRDDIKEIRRFTKKDKTLSIRLIIDYNKFLYCGDNQRVSMFVNALKVMLENIKNFNSSQFNKELLIEKLNSIN